MIKGFLMLIALIGAMLIGEAVAPVAPKWDEPEPVEVVEEIILIDPVVIDPEPEVISLGTFTVTAYCPCEKCCGEWSNPSDPRTASGDPAEEGITVGADWATVAAGTKITIEGIGERIVQDKPARWIIEKYQGRILDLYFQSHSEALKFGKKELEVTIKP